MTLISIDQHQMTHWLPPASDFGRFTVPADMVVPALNSLPCRCGDDWGPGCKCHTLRGVRVNDLDPMPPWTHFRRLTIQKAAAMRDGKRKESLEFVAVTPEADMRVYGPYHHKPPMGLTVVTSRLPGENLHPDKLDFKIWGEFTQKYARALDPGPGRPEHMLKFWADVDREMAERGRIQGLSPTGELILAKR